MSCTNPDMAPRPTTVEAQGALTYELRMSTKITAPNSLNWNFCFHLRIQLFVFVRRMAYQLFFRKEWQTTPHSTGIEYQKSPFT